MEVVGMPVSHEGPHSRHSLVIAVALDDDFAGTELCAIRAISLEVPVDLLLHRIVRATLRKHLLLVEMPVSFHCGLDHDRSLVHDIFAVPAFKRDNNPLTPVQNHCGRHSVISEAIVIGAGDHLVVTYSAAGLALPGLAAVKGADDNSARKRSLLPDILAGSDVHLDLAGRKLEEGRLPAASTVHFDGLRPAPALVGTEGGHYSAVLIGLRQIAVTLVEAPLESHYYTSVLQFDEVRIYIHYSVRGCPALAVAIDRIPAVGNADRIRPGFRTVNAPHCVNVESVMMIREREEDSTVTQMLCTRIIQVLLNIAEARDLCLRYLGICRSVPGNPHLVVLRPLDRTALLAGGRSAGKTCAENCRQSCQKSSFHNQHRFT